MHSDVQDQIDRSFGAGPEHADLDQVLRAGRRSLRRRRVASAGAVLAVALVAGGVVVTAGGPDGVRGEEPAATPTATSAPEDPAYVQVPPDRPELEGEQVVLAPDGTLYVSEDVEVLEVVENPLGLEPPRYSAGLATSAGGEERWWLLEAARTSSSTSSAAARESFPDLGMCLDDQVALQRGEPTLALVRFGPDGTLVPDEAGVEVLAQRAGVDLGPSFAGPGDPTAVAEVRWDGERWYVLARDLGAGPPEYFPTAASVSRPTLDGFLTYARASYDEGTGLR